ncbi:MAG: AbrB/MazE/SpoVT family DNA-binding domain-containing protein [Anaerolineae bacterium]
MLVSLWPRVAIAGLPHSAVHWRRNFRHSDAGVDRAKTVRIGNKGVITLPADLRKRHGLEEGDILTVVDVGDGTFVLSPMVSEVARQGDRVAEIMEEYGVSTEDILQQLADEREQYYREHYAHRDQQSA